ncbi:MAG TPA: DegT/DnrJ/EryC1/StrS family aminotransferase [Armatimonadota bacterium]|nr:DegT/DnrJ/EryC1/StrS family aminotransferase [Armatimonadota bacterium]
MYQIGEEEIQALRRVIESGRLFRYQGDQPSETDLFEREWAARIGVPHAVAVSSGTAGLSCALAGLAIGPGDEVIVPAYTYIATALAVLAVGAVPVLAEVDASLTLDPADAARKITPRTKALLPVHMCGLPCNMDALTALARDNGLAIVEDACQADGGSYKGTRFGAIGDAAAFSFNYFKIITCGEGGAFVTQHDDVYQRGLIYHDAGCPFFRDISEVTVPLFAGMGNRFSELLGAVLRVQATRLDGILAGLRAEKRRLRAALAEETAFTFSPVNDPDGDCGAHLGLLFAREADARAFHAAAPGTGAWIPRDTGRHVYTNWECVMERRGAHVETRNPYAASEVTYTQDMYPATLDVLARTVFIPTTPARGDAEFDALVAALQGAARSAV